jgi:hypothetical protein
MSISIDGYRAAIGTWHLACLSRRIKSPKMKPTPIKIKFLLNLILSSYGVCIGILLILRSGDVHPNPGPTMYENKSLNICHVNIQSLYLRVTTPHRRKIDEIEALLINDAKMDIICISETWLNDNIPLDLVKIEGYEFIRKNRPGDRASGGVGIYITDALPFRRAYELELPNTDLMWIELKLANKKILVGCCYRPPGQLVEEVDLFISDLTDSLELALASNPESLFLLGDFNDSCNQWESDHNHSELKLKLYDLINTFDLHQTVREPTHILDNSANILDLLITDSPGYIINQGQNLLPPIGSIHQIVQAVLQIQYKRDKAYTREIWNFKKGDYTGLVNDLKDVPWGTGQDLFDDIDGQTDFWQTAFMDVCRAKIPNRTIKIRPTDKPWITQDVRKAIRIRNRLYKKFKRTRSPDHQNDWKRSRREANYQMSVAKSAHKDKIKSLLMSPNTGAKKYWKIAKQVYGNKKSIGIPSLVVEGEIVSTSCEKVKHLTKYFAE